MLADLGVQPQLTGIALDGFPLRLEIAERLAASDSVAGPTVVAERRSRRPQRADDVLVQPRSIALATR